MVDYSLWKSIKNGNEPPITKLVEGVKTVIAPSTAEEKAQRRLELKARSILLMGIPNELQLKFNFIKGCQVLLASVEKRFGGNAATKKTQRNLLKQHQLEIHGESISQEDVNQKFLRSLSPEWNTHTFVWRNKLKIDTLRLDDLYNNLKIYVAECFHLPQNGGHFAGSTGFQGNQENRNRENTRSVPVETTTSNALISFLTLRYLLIQIVYHLGLENVKILKEQNEQLLKDLRTSKINAITYKTGLESVEARLLVYKKNESVYEEDIKLLKREIYLKEVAITELRRKLELAQKQKGEIQLTVSLSKLIGCQIVDKCKTGLGYNVVPPSYTGNFMPPKPDLSFSSLEEFVNEPIVSEPTVKKPVVETSEAKNSADKPKAVKKNNGALIIEDWVSDSEEEDVPQAKIQKKIVKPSFAKIEFVKSKEQVKSPRKTTIKQGNQNRLNTHSPRGNQRNWNNMMSQRLGSNFEMINKACYVCGSFDHLQYNCDNHQRQFNNKKMVKPMWNYT
ncbi:hypothetical protein Tco_1090418 [Tanacetum coccineum]|uniref:Uncharacterized protein n=1 Tax=Tanacetum coccineum TaxID=301880 RepID=A0ABQ5I456_9ASTR